MVVSLGFRYNTTLPNINVPVELIRLSSMAEAQCRAFDVFVYSDKTATLLMR